MKKKIAIQVSILLFFMFLWTFISIWYSNQIKEFYAKRSKNTIVVYSSQEGLLEHLKKNIDSLDVIHEIVMESKKDIAEKLIKKYDLNSAESLLNRSSLPDVMQIHVNGEDFDLETKDYIFEQINSLGKYIKIEFNIEEWEAVSKQIFIVNKISLYTNYAFSIVFLLIAILIRIFFERADAHYWSIFYNSGGSHKKRNIRYLISSLIIVLVTSAISLIIVYIFGRFQSIEFDYLLLIKQLLIVTFSGIFARFFIKDMQND